MRTATTVTPAGTFGPADDLGYQQVIFGQPEDHVEPVGRDADGDGDRQCDCGDDDPGNGGTVWQKVQERDKAPRRTGYGISKAAP
jgi:hypothetical protein